MFLKSWLVNIILCLPIIVVLRCAFSWRQLAAHTLDIHRSLVWSLVVSLVWGLILTLCKAKNG